MVSICVVPLVLVVIITLSTFILSIFPLEADVRYNRSQRRKENSEFYKRTRLYVIPVSNQDMVTYKEFLFNETVWQDINRTMLPKKSEILELERRDEILQIFATLTFGSVAMLFLTYAIIAFTNLNSDRWKPASKINLLFHVPVWLIWVSGSLCYFLSFVTFIGSNYDGVTEITLKAMNDTEHKIVFRDRPTHYCTQAYRDDPQSAYHLSLPEKTREEYKSLADSTGICHMAYYKLITICLAALICGLHGVYTYLLSLYISCCQHAELVPAANPAHEVMGQIDFTDFDTFPGLRPKSTVSETTQTDPDEIAEAAHSAHSSYTK